ncbi:hypothetical protein M2281_002756 [Mesorhizobium soli]|nr:hypothetical protein [Mesorhizobium soli]
MRRLSGDRDRDWLKPTIACRLRRRGSTARSGSFQMRRGWQSGRSGAPATKATSSLSARTCIMISRAVPSMISMARTNSRYSIAQADRQESYRGSRHGRRRESAPDRLAPAVVTACSSLPMPAATPSTKCRAGPGRAARMAFKQENSKLTLERLDPCADARLADAERCGRMAKIQILGDGRHLDQRCEGMRDPRS